MNAGYKTVKSKIFVVALTLLMVFGNVVSPLSGAFYVYGASKSVSTWAELKSAIASGEESIDVTADLYADSTIEISSNVEITSSNGATIYQKERDKYDTMFSVVSGGDLTLDDGLTLSGKTTKCTSGTPKTYEDITTIPGKPAGTTLKCDNGTMYLEPGSNDTTILGIKSDGSKSSPLTVGSDGELKFEGQAVGPRAGTYGTPSQIGFTVYTADNNLLATALEDGKEYVLFDREVRSYLMHMGGTAFDFKDDYRTATKWTASTSYSSEGTKYEFNGEEYDSEDEAKTAVDKYNADLQKCEDAYCAKYTKDNFESGSTDAPRGFFVQVAESGTLNLTGAKLENFITDGTVTHAAPVVVNKGKFNMTGGSIEHNSVGYTANNDKSTARANTIGYRSKTRSYKDTGLLGDWERTETAGAVILTNGANGSLSGDAKIDDNRADTGAIVAQGFGDEGSSTKTYSGSPTTLKIDGNAEISNNIGVHYAGAINIFNGASVEMMNGALANNFSWNKGGAVLASEEIYGSVLKSADFEAQKVGEATFILRDGEISGNHAVQRGGAICVQSDHVALLAGNITGNSCRVVGGAIYVEGDGAKRNYRLYIKEGDITKNNAVDSRSPSKEGASALYVSLDSASNCGKVNTTGTAGSNISDGLDFADYVGHGGGIWLCPIGGTAALISADETTGTTYNVFIGDNKASNTDKKWGDPSGNDIQVRPFRAGKVNGINLVGTSDYNLFKDETNGSILEVNRVYSGKLGLTNTLNKTVGKGVIISGNTAAIGGGIGSNGTIVLGAPNDSYNANAKLSLTKKWSGSIPDDQRKPVIFELYVDGSEEAMDSVVLNGKKDELSEGDENSIEGIDIYGENDTAIEETPWVASFGLPLVVMSKDKALPVAILEVDGEEKDPSIEAGIKDILKAVDEGKEIKVKQWNVTVKEFEYVEDSEDHKGAELDFISLAEVSLKSTSKGAVEKTVITTPSGDPVVTFSTYTLDFTVGEKFGNDAKPEIEKYVEQAVHKDIQLDEEFTYDILAYVTMDADEVVITDTLVDDLEFVSKAEDIKILDIGEKNNHDVNYTVDGKASGKNGSVSISKGDAVVVEEDDSAVATEIAGDGVDVQITDGKTLTVKLDNGISVDAETGKINRAYNTVTALRGHWIKVTFKAQIKKELQTKLENGEMTLSKLRNVKVEADKVYKADDSIYSDNRPEENVGNAPVNSDENHDGIDNTASYKISVPNEAGVLTKKYEDESNTVTVKPKEYKVKISKQDLNGNELDDAQMKVTGPAGFEETWTSVADNPKELSLIPGRYVMEEIVAPEGYNNATVTTKIEFEIDKDGNVTIVGASEEQNGIDLDNDCRFEFLDTDHLVLKDSLKKNEIKISKQDLGGNELTGAEMKLTGPNGFSEEWVSDAENVKTFSLPMGEYELTEVVAPTGYNNATVTTKIQFKVDAEGNVSIVGASEEQSGIDLDNDCRFEILDTDHLVLKDSPKQYDFKISKQDLGDDTKELPGAEIEIKDENGEVVEKWTSTEEPHEVKLIPGEYELIEVVAPEGYNKATVTTTIKFTVEPDGTVKIVGATEEYNGVEVDNGCKFEVLEPDHLVLKDTPNPTIKVTKADLAGEEVEGAEIEIRDEEGNVVEKWISEKEGHEFTIEPGEYELVEVVAPDGYNKATVTTTIKFTVDHEGNITLKGATEEYNGLELDNDCVVEIDVNSADHLILKDSPYTDVSISKKALGGDELEGAEMELLDSEGNVIDSWTSTKDAHDIKLPNGEYTLVEKVAPEGYQCVTTKMQFKVENGTVTLLTAEVDNGGKITVMEGNNFVLEDAPKQVQDSFEPPVEDNDSVLGVSEDEAEVRGVNKVKTGDDSMLSIWLMMLMISICAIAFGAVKRLRAHR